MITLSLKTIFGILLIGTSIGDAIKYSIQALKIRRNQSSKNISRKFLNFAILNDVVKFMYGVAIFDLYIIVSSIMALICMLHMFYEQYTFYPYKMRGCFHFKRPSILIYIWNSILPNHKRKRL